MRFGDEPSENLIRRFANALDADEKPLLVEKIPESIGHRFDDKGSPERWLFAKEAERL